MKKLPFVELNDKLVLTDSSPEALADSKFEGRLFGETVKLDHITLVRPTVAAFEQTCEFLVRLGATALEEPCRWPVEACPEIELPPGMEMMLGTYGVTDGSLVIASPLEEGDQLSRFITENGTRTLHHAAVIVDDIVAALPRWRARGFVPGPIADDGELAQVFMRHPGGQLVELIHRRHTGFATFTCNNIAQLRQSENILETRR